MTQDRHGCLNALEWFPYNGPGRDKNVIEVVSINY